VARQRGSAATAAAFYTGSGSGGQVQSDSYLEHTKDQLWSLREQPLIGIDRSELLPDVRSLLIASHTLFYRVTTDRVEIIRLLHGRQDPQRHLK
jgi:toxin ParE1/3/4